MYLRPILLAVVVSLTVVAPPALAQWLDYPTPNVPKTKDGKPDLNAPAPRLGNGKPDFSGMWGWDAITPCGSRCTDNQISTEFINIAAKLVSVDGKPVARGAGGGRGGGRGGGFGGGQLPYTDWARDVVAKRMADGAKDDPNVHCMPRGMPRIWTDDYYKRIFMASDRMLMLMERNMQYRQIHMDGRPLPDDPTPTWNGYSTAAWERDTLVVHTIGFRDDLWLDSNGNPLTNSGKVTERITRPNFGTLAVEMTIEDPKAYTAPWTVKIPVPLVLDSELLDYYCLDNEKDAAHMGSSWTQSPTPAKGAVKGNGK